MFELMDAYSQSAVIKVLGVGGGGGNAVADTDIIGTVEEWRKAEEWWAEFWCWEETRSETAHRLGMVADDAYTMYYEDPDTGQSVKALPWVLLDRYY